MLVSIVIPCYNVEAYIAECIECVINQTYKQLEIICIDNNSNDTTLQALQALKAKYPQIIISKESKPGAPAARNKGLALANGSWIQFLDADDLLLPAKIEHQMNIILASNEPFSFIAAAYKRRLVSGIGKIVDVNLYDQLLGPFINECGITSSNLWNKNDVLEVGAWNEAISSSQETELMLRLVFNSKKYVLDKTYLTIVRDRESGQISQSNPEKKWKQYIQIRIDYLNKLKLSNLEKYKLHRGIFYDFLLVSIIYLSQFNKLEAIKIYKRSIAENWHSAGKYGFTKFKVALIKVMGLNFFLNLKK